MIMSTQIENIEISCDYTTSERAGAGGMFQVSSITIKTKSGDLHPDFDAGQHYSTLEDVIRDLGFDPAQTIYTEV